jgi:hypothetical protein
VRRLLADHIGNLGLATIRMADDLASPDIYKCRAKMRHGIPYQLQNFYYAYLDRMIRTSNWFDESICLYTTNMLTRQTSVATALIASDPLSLTPFSSLAMKRFPMLFK